MHWFMFNKDRPGELVFRFPWLPLWMNYNPEIPEKLFEAIKSVIPKGLDPESVTEDFWDLLDEAAAKAIEKALPYVKDAGQIIRALRTVELDAQRAPKAILRRSISGDDTTPPQISL